MSLFEASETANRRRAQPLAARMRPASLDDLTVRRHMTTAVITVSPDDEVARTMGLMTQHRVRHLPICEDDNLVGIISIGDLVKAQHDELSLENQALLNYIQS